MYDYHVVLAAVSTFLYLGSFALYFRSIFLSTTKPHPFTWFIWGLINVIAFFAQLAEGGGVGTAVTAAVALGCLTIATLSLSRGEKQIVIIDWFCFLGALLSIVLWQLTGNPLVAIVLIVITDALALAPTFRKAYWKPHEEAALPYTVGVISFLLQIAAFEVLNPTTVLYPAFIVVADSLLVVVLLLRRRQLATQAQKV